jgi:class 3 adenylate cyclase
MFGDLVSSTELSARLDPEDLRADRRYHRCCAGGIEQRRFCHIHGRQGARLFRYPRADERAERAVRAGLELVEAVAAPTPRQTPCR